jgi:NADH-quinone oxidoreductase subunit F
VNVVALGAANTGWARQPARIVSERRRKPGYYEIEVGKVTLRELIHDPAFGGGLREGRQLKAVIPGGSSAKVLKAGEKFKLKRKGPDGKDVEQEVDMLELPYDFDSLMAAGTMSGSSAVIVLDDSTDIVEALANISEFYAHESCGQCTPCREGSLWMSKALHRLTHGEGRAQDADYLLKIADNIPGGRTICAFGEACSWPVQSFVGKFKDEFIAKGAAAEAAHAAATAATPHLGRRATPPPPLTLSRDTFIMSTADTASAKPAPPAAPAPPTRAGSVTVVVDGKIGARARLIR